MSILLLDEMKPGVVFSQTVTITRNVDIKHVRPWVYIHGILADGDFVCRIKDAGKVLAMDTISFSEINAIGSDTFKHGKIKFDIEPGVLHIPDNSVSKNFEIEFEMINHTLDPANFIGIVRDWEDPVWIDISNVPNAAVSPCGLEIYDFREKL